MRRGGNYYDSSVVYEMWRRNEAPEFWCVQFLTKKVAPDEEFYDFELKERFFTSPQQAKGFHAWCRRKKGFTVMRAILHYAAGGMPASRDTFDRNVDGVDWLKEAVQEAIDEGKTLEEVCKKYRHIKAEEIRDMWRYVTTGELTEEIY